MEESYEFLKNENPLDSSGSRAGEIGSREVCLFSFVCLFFVLAMKVNYVIIGKISYKEVSP